MKLKSKIKNHLISQIDFRRLFDILPYQFAKFPNKAALVQKQNLGWQKFSTDECITQINRVSAGLLNLGLKRGEKIAIMTQVGSPRWNFLDFGAQQVGGVLVPIHAQARTHEIEYILNDAGVKFLVVANREFYERVIPLTEKVVSLKRVFTLEKLPEIPHFDDLSEEPTDRHLAEFEGRKASIHEDDLATIIYTSGTTGNPKGVMLSHKNLVSNIKATISLVPINCDKRTFSFLPMSHVFERMVTYTYMAVGASVYYAERRDTLVENIKEIRPHYFASVPRFLERTYDTIVEEGENKGKISKRILHWAIRLGERYDSQMGLIYFLQLKIADFLIYRLWRNALGGKVEGVVVGAAALQPRLGKLFSAAGIDIREGYGMTETSPVISFNRFEPGGIHFGTVGIPVPGVEVKIDSPDKNGDGVILVKGPNVMMGYHNLPERTMAVLDEDGWLMTGDVGQFIHKRFLKITGRKKDIFKTSSGKYIVPTVLEQKLNASPFIDNCMVLGFQKPFVTALITPNFSQLKKWCVENNVHWTAPQFMVINPKVEKFMKKVVAEVNTYLKKEERIHKFYLLFEPWEVATGELTYTLKLKRNFVFEKYRKDIEKMYE
ncbi:MAG: long-chain fatty acid--CoA ligase [Saprospiraceae bacterium]|nr:long-chain fatty acid--CoA ligase [bacterium]MDC3209857.1 long-chain fatty acid--CoA ligase [Saprospiraceae bacterium]MDG1434394.1 long-chain fatty acid--CoA ligase [Saprospiraceae bacterium]MDG2417450.1 long-chain fatty acid--CoA ligase [Saprospiraceae bacterium]